MLYHVTGFLHFNPPHKPTQPWCMFTDLSSHVRSTDAGQVSSCPLLRYRSNMTLFSRIELFDAIVLSSRDPKGSNNIWLFSQQFEWSRVNGDSNSHLQVLGMKQTVRWHFTSSDLKVTLSHAIVILFNTYVSIVLLKAISSFLFYCCDCI